MLLSWPYLISILTLEALPYLVPASLSTVLTERLSGSPKVIVLLKLDFPSVPSTPPTDDVLVVTSYFVAMSVPLDCLML